MNDNAVALIDRSVWIAGKLTPTENDYPLWERGLPAMNDNAVALMDRSAFIASKLTPTED